MKIPFVTLEPLNKLLQKDYHDAFDRVLVGGQFILGDECRKFEQEFSEWNNVCSTVGVANGLDALFLALTALGVGAGDEVIVPANTFVATALAVSKVGAKLVLVDPDKDTYNMSCEGFKEAITDKTKAVIPVHLYGQPAEVFEIVELAHQEGIFVVEDCAQAHGALYCGTKVGGLGDLGCYSFYPGKNFGALGDGGCVTSNDEALIQKIREFANYGSSKKYHHDVKGTNSRLDELQAAFLRAKLPHLDTIIAARQDIAQRYLAGITNPLIQLPMLASHRTHVWHIFPVLCEQRDKLQRFLEKEGIATGIHYPIPIHLQEAYIHDGFSAFPVAEYQAKNELSLPMYFGLSFEEVDYVIDVLNRFQ